MRIFHPNQKIPQQMWVEADFLSDALVRRMTPEAQWITRQLMQQAWVCDSRPRLPDNDDELWLLAGCGSKEQWIKYAPEVRPMFNVVVIEGVSLLERRRLVTDWERVICARERMSTGGKNSTKARHKRSGTEGGGVSNTHTDREIEREYTLDNLNGTSKVLTNTHNTQDIQTPSAPNSEIDPPSPSLTTFTPSLAQLVAKKYGLPPKTDEIKKFSLFEPAHVMQALEKFIREKHEIKPDKGVTKFFDQGCGVALVQNLIEEIQSGSGPNVREQDIATMTKIVYETVQKTPTKAQIRRALEKLPIEDLIEAFSRFVGGSDKKATGSSIVKQFFDDGGLEAEASCLYENVASAVGRSMKE